MLAWRSRCTAFCVARSRDSLHAGNLLYDGRKTPAYAKRQVPQTVFAGGGDATGGLDSNTQAFMQMLTMKAARDLELDMSIRKGLVA